MCRSSEEDIDLLKPLFATFLPLFWQLFNNNFIDKSVDIPMIPSHLGDDRRLRHVIVLRLAHSNKIRKIWRPHHRAAQGGPPR